MHLCNVYILRAKTQCLVSCTHTHTLRSGDKQTVQADMQTSVVRLLLDLEWGLATKRIHRWGVPYMNMDTIMLIAAELACRVQHLHIDHSTDITRLN